MGVPRRKRYSPEMAQAIVKEARKQGKTLYVCADGTIRAPEDIPPLAGGRRRYTNRSKYDARTGKLIEA